MYRYEYDPIDGGDLIDPHQDIIASGLRLEDAEMLVEYFNATEKLIDAAEAVDMQVGRCVGIDAESLANLRAALDGCRPNLRSRSQEGEE